MRPLYASIKDYDLDSENKINTKNNLQIQTHCHSCGAPVNPYLEKCEYCGTYYAVSSNMPVKLNQAKTDFKASLEKFNRAMQVSMLSPNDIRRYL